MGSVSLGAIQKSYIEQNVIISVQQSPDRQPGRHTGLPLPNPSFDSRYACRGGPMCPPYASALCCPPFCLGLPASLFCIAPVSLNISTAYQYAPLGVFMSRKMTGEGHPSGRSCLRPYFQGKPAGINPGIRFRTEEVVVFPELPTDESAFVLTPK